MAYDEMAQQSKSNFLSTGILSDECVQQLIHRVQELTDNTMNQLRQVSETTALKRYRDADPAVIDKAVVQNFYRGLKLITNWNLHIKVEEGNQAVKKYPFLPKLYRYACLRLFRDSFQAKKRSDKPVKLSIPPFHDFLHMFYSNVATSDTLQNVMYHKLYGFEKKMLFADALRVTLFHCIEGALLDAALPGDDEFQDEPEAPKVSEPADDQEQQSPLTLVPRKAESPEPNATSESSPESPKPKPAESPKTLSKPASPKPFAVPAAKSSYLPESNKPLSAKRTPADAKPPSAKPVSARPSILQTPPAATPPSAKPVMSSKPTPVSVHSATRAIDLTAPFAKSSPALNPPASARTEVRRTFILPPSLMPEVKEREPKQHLSPSKLNAFKEAVEKEAATVEKVIDLDAPSAMPAEEPQSNAFFDNLDDIPQATEETLVA